MWQGKQDSMSRGK